MSDRPLRIALTSYRSKPHCGGQGIYVREISRALVRLGHRVEVFSGPPYPELTDGVRLTEVPSLDLYAEENPFRVPRPREFRSGTDLLEFAIMCTAGFPEPRTFSRRVVPLLAARAHEFDVVHDNQTFGTALLKLPALGLPLVGTMHHPISKDRELALAEASLRKQLPLRRWYGFLGMQAKVARRIPLMVTPSHNSATDAASDFGLRPEQLVHVPIGVDVDHFHPRGPRVPGRIVTLCSADVPLKGLQVLLRAMALLPQDSPAQLIAVTRPEPGGPTEKLVAELGIAHRVTFVSGLADTDLAELIASAQLAVVPSLYEGFSLPAVEAMASGTPLIATDTAALPEVVGRDGSCGLLVEPGNAAALALAISTLLADAPRRAAMSVTARQRVQQKFSWTVTARQTVEVYRRVIAAGGRDGAGEVTRC